MTDKAGHVIGSSLLAQPFAKDEYLHPRPSAAGAGYDPTSSGGSNYGPLSPDLAKRIKGDAAAMRASTGQNRIPDDAVTASASGLDPDISPDYALLQAARIAKARGRLPLAAPRDQGPPRRARTAGHSRAERRFGYVQTAPSP